MHVVVWNRTPSLAPPPRKEPKQALKGASTSVHQLERQGEVVAQTGEPEGAVGWAHAAPATPLTRTHPAHRAGLGVKGRDTAPFGPVAAETPLRARASRLEGDPSSDPK